MINYFEECLCVPGIYRDKPFLPKDNDMLNSISKKTLEVKN